MIVNKRMTLQGREYASGEEIAVADWLALRERTRQSLVSGRFVISPEDALARGQRAAQRAAAAPSPAAPKKRRGRPPKVKEAGHV